VCLARDPSAGSGAHTDAKDAEGRTPLQAARAAGRTRLVALLEASEQARRARIWPRILPPCAPRSQHALTRSPPPQARRARYATLDAEIDAAKARRAADADARHPDAARIACAA
jgi:hypothetical protein